MFMLIPTRKCHFKTPNKHISPLTGKQMCVCVCCVWARRQHELCSMIKTPWWLFEVGHEIRFRLFPLYFAFITISKLPFYYVRKKTSEVGNCANIAPDSYDMTKSTERKSTSTKLETKFPCVFRLSTQHILTSKSLFQHQCLYLCNQMEMQGLSEQQPPESPHTHTSNGQCLTRLCMASQ